MERLSQSAELAVFTAIVSMIPMTVPEERK
jgi:hypothetical protein